MRPVDSVKKVALNAIVKHARLVNQGTFLIVISIATTVLMVAVIVLKEMLSIVLNASPDFSLLLEGTVKNATQIALFVRISTVLSIATRDPIRTLVRVSVSNATIIVKHVTRTVA